MGPVHNWAPDFWWVPRNLVSKKIGPCMKIIMKYFHARTKFLGAPISRGGQKIQESKWDWGPFQLKPKLNVLQVILWIDIVPGKVWTFWETFKIWKNLPHGFDKSADLHSKRQNHEEDFFIMCASQKIRTLFEILEI